MSVKDSRFSRIIQLLGQEKHDKLVNAHVGIVGLGATGGYATEALARAGVGKLTLIDFDTVDKSNINRQLYALESTLGRRKSELAYVRVTDINPDCIVKAQHSFVNSETINTLFDEQPELIVDAIDSVNPKVELLAYAVTNEIPLVSCMGAALRTDPFKIKIGTLDKVRNCPLAKQIRKRLRRRDISLNFTCIYSDEDHSPEAIGDYSPGSSEFKGRKRRVMGSMSTITGIFGLILADTAIKKILEK